MQNDQIFQAENILLKIGLKYSGIKFKKKSLAVKNLWL